MRRICLIGIDGAGKTTHIKLLHEKLTYYGKRCKCINLRGLYFRLFSLSLILLCNIMKMNVNKNKLIFPYVVTSNVFVRKFFSLLFFVDLTVLAFFRGFFLNNVDYLLSDRGILDSCVDLMVFSNFYKLHKSRIFNFFMRLLKSDLIILLDVDENIAYRRICKREALDFYFLKKARRYYIYLASKYKLPIVRTDKEISEVQKNIQQYVLEYV